MKLILKLIVTLGLILSANQVHSTPISATLNSWGNGWSESVQFSFNGSEPINASAGLFNFTNNSTQSDFLAFCVEITESISFGTTANFTIYPATDPIPFGVGPEVAEYIGRLYTNKYSSISNAVTAAAFQISLWEILYEDYFTNGFDLGVGNFTLSQVSGGGTILAHEYLNSLNFWTNSSIISFYHNDGIQDQFQIYPLYLETIPLLINVNEPLGLLLFGLLGLASILHKYRTRIMLS